MIFNFTISPGEYVNAWRLYANSRRSANASKLFVLCCGLFVLGLGVWEFTKGVWILGVLFSFLGVGLLLWYEILYRWWLPRDFAKHPYLQEEMHFEVTEAGLKVGTRLSTGEVSWQVFTEWIEGSDLFLLMQGPRCFNIVPKRALATDAIDQFRQLLQTHVKKH